MCTCQPRAVSHRLCDWPGGAHLQRQASDRRRKKHNNDSDLLAMGRTDNSSVFDKLQKESVFFLRLQIINCINCTSLYIKDKPECLI